MLQGSVGNWGALRIAQLLRLDTNEGMEKGRSEKIRERKDTSRWKSSGKTGVEGKIQEPNQYARATNDCLFPLAATPKKLSGNAHTYRPARLLNKQFACLLRKLLHAIIKKMLQLAT